MRHAARSGVARGTRPPRALTDRLDRRYLHGRTPLVIHRDLKPLNCLLHEGHLKLCDFGLASEKSRTVGTPHYMAPELLLDKPYSAKVDVFAFGIMLWEMFTRQLP